MSVKQPTTTEAIASRIVGSGTADPATLVANPRNWRTHPPEQRAALEAELARVGWVQGVLVNRTTGNLVDGHLRAKVAAERGEASIPVVYVELSLEEEARVLLSLDPLGAMAGTDQALLTDLMAGLDLENAALEKHLRSLAGHHPGTIGADFVPPERPDTYIERGSVWALGRHRLMCGDATSPADVALVLGGERPALMITDPPYGVEYEPEWRAAYKEGQGMSFGKVGNDDRADWREAWALSPASVAYVWHGGLHGGIAQEALEATGFELRAVIVWVKQRSIFGRGAYHWQHEPCFYAVRKGATAGWIGPVFESTVWNVNTLGGYLHAGEADMATEHSTQKPVEVMARGMRCHKGDVYDPFLGSGTTLIAAEQLNRTFFGLDLEPRYVQVAIERWQAFTGLQASRVV